MGQFGFGDIIGGGERTPKERPEVAFSECLGEENNYVILQFKTDIDWIYAQSVLDLEPKMCSSTRKDGKITEGMQRIGTGRVLDGPSTLEKLKGAC